MGKTVGDTSTAGRVLPAFETVTRIFPRSVVAVGQWSNLTLFDAGRDSGDDR
jgi:hypothetical protein